MTKPTLMVGLLSGIDAVPWRVNWARNYNKYIEHKLVQKKKICFTVPLIFGLALWASILPTSHDNTLLTGSNAYFPWLTVRVQFKTDLGMGISTLTDSNYKKTLLKCDLFWYFSSRKFATHSTPHSLPRRYADV